MIALKDIYLFQNIPSKLINKIIDNSRRVEFEAENTIISEGDISNDEAYIIQEGIATVTRNGEFIKELSAPDIFGEIALITNEARTATVEAKTDMILLKLNKDLLHTILKDFPNGKHIQEVIRERIVENISN